MKISVLTLFPELFESFFKTSLIGRAERDQILNHQLINFRQECDDRHQSVDDEPYGGGPGMVIKVEPVYRACKKLEGFDAPKTARLMLSASGQKFSQAWAQSLASDYDHMVLLCGRYEGFDERVVEALDFQEVCIGDFVGMGGEAPAKMLIEAVVRLRPGVLGDEESALAESFVKDAWLDHPHYTRPQEFAGLSVPEVLLSGDHAQVAAWRHEQAMAKTKRQRPDLLKDQ